MIARPAPVRFQHAAPGVHENEATPALSGSPRRRPTSHGTSCRIRAVLMFLQPIYPPGALVAANCRDLNQALRRARPASSSPPTALFRLLFGAGAASARDDSSHHAPMTAYTESSGTSDGTRYGSPGPTRVAEFISARFEFAAGAAPPHSSGSPAAHPPVATASAKTILFLHTTSQLAAGTASRFR